jgi:hypothetical protein
MYNKAGLLTRLSQLWEVEREDDVRCIAHALGLNQPTAAVVRLAARLPDSAERAAAAWMDQRRPRSVIDHTGRVCNKPELPQTAFYRAH